MRTALQAVQDLIVHFTTIIAQLSEELATALANVAASAEAIAAAEQAAADAAIARDAAIAKSAELQALVDSDTTEDASINELVDGVINAPVE